MLDRSAEGFHPIPPFDVCEDTDFSFNISRWVSEPTGRRVVGMTVVNENFDINRKMDRVMWDMFSFGEQRRARRRATGILPFQGKTVEQSDPIVRNYDPPDIPITGQIIGNSVYVGMEGVPNIHVRWQPSQRSIDHGYPTGIQFGDRYFLEGRSPELLYSSKYKFSIIAIFARDRDLFVPGGPVPPALTGTGRKLLSVFSLDDRIPGVDELRDQVAFLWQNLFGGHLPMEFNILNLGTLLSTEKINIVKASTDMIVTGAPEWTQIPTIVIRELESIYIDLKPYVKNQVDTWSLVTTRATPTHRELIPGGPATGVPLFPLELSRDGILSSPVRVPDWLKQNITYSFQVTASNHCGSGSKFGHFQIVEDAPTFGRDPLDYEVDEKAGDGDILVGDIKDKMINWQNDPADSFTIETFGKHPPDAPQPEFYITKDGLIYLKAPILVDVDVTYWVKITAVNDGGMAEYYGNIRVRAQKPRWRRIDDRSSPEGTVIDFILPTSQILNFPEAHSDTSPIRYRIKTAPPATNAPKLNLRVTSLPKSQGACRVHMPGTATAPYVDEDTRYTVTLEATNAASRNVWVPVTYRHTITNTAAPTPEGGGLLPARWSANQIPDYFMDESDVFDIDLSGYVEGDPATWELTAIRASNSDAPNISIVGQNRLDIHSIGPNEGTIYGVGSLGYTEEQADEGIFYPNVTKDEGYTITVRITGDNVSDTDASRAFLLVIRQKRPRWGTIPPLNEDELESFSHDISQYVEHEPDEFNVVATPNNSSSLDPPPPDLEFDVSDEGVISHDELPEVARDEPYSVAVTGTNTAGSDTGYFIFTVNQTPPEWKDIPKQSGEEESDLLINLNSFADKEPDEFSIVSTVKGRASAPDLSLSADATTGLISKTLPKVEQTETYTVTARCSNTAGDAVPDAVFMLDVVNSAPVWSYIPNIIMPESSTRVVSLYSYVEDFDGVTFTSGTPELTGYAGTGTPTLTATTSTAGVMTLGAGAVNATAYWRVPISAENDAPGSPTSASLYVTVTDITQTPVFTHCEDQEFNELTQMNFSVTARSNLTITYSRRSGPTWVNIGSLTGVVTGRTPEVAGSLTGNPYDDYTVVFRASVTNTAVNPSVTETADCTVRIRVFNTDVPAVETPAEWISDIEDRAYVERARFSFNISRHAHGLPVPTIGETTDSDTPDFVSISSGGQVSGDGPSVGEVFTVATNDGRVWKMVMSAGRVATQSQITISSSALPSGVVLKHVVRGLKTTEYYLVLSEPVTTLQRIDVTISGSPSVTVSNLTSTWYVNHPVYVTCANVANDSAFSDNTSFDMLFINTDPKNPQPPDLDVPDQSVNEGAEFDIDLTFFTTGDPPFTYERTLISGGPRRLALPDWESRGGTGLNLTSAGRLFGTAPRVVDSERESVTVTARNSAGTSPDTFIIEITNVEPPVPFEEPEWNIRDKTIIEGGTLDINPIRDNELTGTMPIEITLTDSDEDPLPRWVTLSNNVLSGTAPSVTADVPSEIKLTATNTDHDGTDYPEPVEFTLTVLNDTPDPPDWDIDNLTVDEGDGVTIDPLSNGELSGGRPITITVTPNSVVSPPSDQTTNLPSWLTKNGNIFTGTAPLVSETRTDVVRLTATNSHGVDRASFTITIRDVPEPPPPSHNPPVWNMPDTFSVTELSPFRIDIFNTDGEGSVLLTGDTPLTVTVLPNSVTAPPSDQMTNLPSWLSLSNAVITGTHPDTLTRDKDYTVRLRASNIDSAMVTHNADVSFTIRVKNKVVLDCDPIRIRGRLKYIEDLGLNIIEMRRWTITTEDSGVIDIRDRIIGTNPFVYDDPDFSSLPFIVNPTNHGTGLIQWKTPTKRSEWERLIGVHWQVIEVINDCTPVPIKAAFQIYVRQKRHIPPVWGECPPITLDAGDYWSLGGAGLDGLLTSTHTQDFPKFRKVQNLNEESNPWQYADWWTADEVGNFSISPPIDLVQRDTTRTLEIEAYNADGHDVLRCELTVIYIPQPPTCIIDPLPEPKTVDSGQILRVQILIDEDIKGNFNRVVLTRVERITVGSPEIFLKVESTTNGRSTIVGADNSSNGGGVGTSDLRPVGEAATVDSESAPEVVLQTDYRVYYTATNTGLITTARYPLNSADCSFILRINAAEEPPLDPSCLQIPLHPSCGGESVSIGVGNNFKNVVRYEIVSVVHSAMENPGTIVLQINNAGVITRQGGAVAPTVRTEARYRVTVRGYNSAGAHVDCAFTWAIINCQRDPGTATSFITTNSGGSRLYEWDHNTRQIAEPVAGVPMIGSSINGYLFMEGVNQTLWYLTSSGQLGTIAYDGRTAVRTQVGTITATGVVSWKGLTSIGSVLYSFGHTNNHLTNSNSPFRLFSIDTGTRRATAVNTASGADNIGVLVPGSSATGLTSSGTNIYTIGNTQRQLNGSIQFIRIPTTGTLRGIGVVVNSNIFATAPLVDTRFFSFSDMETFGSTIQVSLPRGVRGDSGRLSYNFTTSGTTDNTTGSAFFAITQHSIVKPTINRIPVQCVQEGQVINFPLASYVTNADGYRIGSLRRVEPTNSPALSLEVTSDGTIRGTSGNLNAPLVNENSYYLLKFFAYSTGGGEVSQDITICVLEAPPIWSSVPPQFVNEGDRISFGLLPYVQNNPTSFRVGTITKPRDEAPNLFLQMNRHGTLFGVGATEEAPPVTRDERYDVQVFAENAAGERATTISLTVEDLGTLAEQVPYVRRWDTPERAQGGSFHILIDFNIPVYGLRPGSFVIEGVELRGLPFLLWSPVPSLDTIENRPNADARSLDYLTTPVPVTGTKYFKLEFPRDILPATVEEEQLMNIYLTSNAVRGGVVE